MFIIVNMSLSMSVRVATQAQMFTMMKITVFQQQPSHFSRALAYLGWTCGTGRSRSSPAGSCSERTASPSSAPAGAAGPGSALPGSGCWPVWCLCSAGHPASEEQTQKEGG